MIARLRPPRSQQKPIRVKPKKTRDIASSTCAPPLTLIKSADRGNQRAEFLELSERSRRLLESPLSFIGHPSFEIREQAREIEADDVLDDADQAVHRSRRVELPPDAPAYFAALYEVPLLTPDIERRMFRKMNYLKWLANRQLGKLSARQPSEKIVERIDDLRKRAQAIRDRIISANLRLVVSIARRFSEQVGSFSDLVSDGNLTLMYAVEKFDFGRGFRFSTYATLAIQRELVRQVRRSPIDRLCKSDDVGEYPDPAQPDKENDASRLIHNKRIRRMEELMDEHLDARERFVVAARYGINQPEGPQALRAIGTKLGVSKERVRQLQLRAIEALREAAGLEDNVPSSLALSAARRSVGANDAEDHPFGRKSDRKIIS